MTSKAAMLGHVQNLRWRDVAVGLREQPGLLRFRDRKGRNWLHLVCALNPRKRGLNPRSAVRAADVLLEAGLDIDGAAFQEGSWKATPLWHAIARGGNLPLARALLARGADPEHCLWAAAYREDLAAIRLLVAHGAEVDPVAEDETPFLHAVRWSRFRAAEALLSLGADVNFQDSRDRTALHLMLSKGSAEKHFRTLIRFGARGDLEDRDGQSARKIMMRKRSPGLRKLASHLAAGD